MNIPAEIKVNGKWRPTRNSEGRLIHPTPEGLLAFWKWFGDSKVVDDKGRPLVVYHGADDEFDTFIASESKHGAHTGAGHYFTSRQERARGYGAVVMPVYLCANRPFGRANLSRAEVEALTSITLQMSDKTYIHNPEKESVFTDQIEFRRFYYSKVAQWEANNGLQSHRPEGVFGPGGTYLVRWRDYSTTAISSKVEVALSDLLGQYGPSASLVLDAAGFDAIFGGDFRNGADIVVFKPTQIKSATGNRGTFDGADPVMTNPRRRNPCGSATRK